MPDAPRRHRRRLMAVGAVRAVIGIITATVMILVLPNLWPRSFTMPEIANIDPVPITVGFADGADLLALSPADMYRTLDLMKSTGSRTVRIPILWSTVEPVQGKQNWASIDKIVDAAVARSMSILGVIAFTPGWEQAPGGDRITSRPASPAAFADFAAVVAGRYKGKISAYEIWNEPNTSMFYSPGPDPAGYTSLLKATYPKIKAVSPLSTVLGGVLSSVITTSTTLDPVAFVTQMYSAGAQSFFDALSFHPYQYTLPFSAGMAIADSPVLQLIAMRQVMVRNGDAEKKIWATEYGEPTSLTSEVGQSEFITDFVTKWQEMPYAGPIMIYRARDIETGSPDPEHTFGVFRTDWTPKLIQPALQSLISSGIPKSAEFQRFSTVTDPSHGIVLSPVYRATPTVWAQRRSVNTLYETPSGFIASPNPVADKALTIGVAPTTPFANGWQDFARPSGVRIFYSEQTGAHAIGDGIASAWTPPLGLATTDEVPMPDGGVSVSFQRGTITWHPGKGALVSYA